MTEGPRIGVDEWVERARLERSWLGRLSDRFVALPPAARVGALAVPIAVFPLLTGSDYLMQVGLDTLIFMLLAVGLNVAVGWAGLLDLGYVAFFGFGAYSYAWLASDNFGRHWDFHFIFPVVLGASMLLGFLVGLPSRRLVGDYLAIVTLFFLQIFLTVAINATDVNVPFVERNVNFTRGPNGISDLEPLTLFGWTLDSLDDYFYLALGAFAVITLGLYFLDQSRTGRAWRALREDALAAELMSMPVNRLKLMAFAIGAGIAGVTGSIFAAEQSAVFPVNFDLVLLITVYAMVILGGAGSLGGVAIGAIVVNASLEALRTPENASWLFFGALALVLPFFVRPWWRWLTVLAGTLAFGFVVHLLAGAVWERGVAGKTVGGTWIDGVADSWVLLPADPGGLLRLGYLALVAAVLGLTLLRGWWRTLGLIPVLYLAACVWENVMLPQPAVARYILIGAMLVALMATRPAGLFGKARVEIV